MLSIAILSLNSSNLLLLPSISYIQPPKSSKRRKHFQETNRTNESSYIHPSFHCRCSRKDSSFATHLSDQYDFSTTQDGNFTGSADGPFISQSAEFDALSVLLQPFCAVKDVREVHAVLLKGLQYTLTFVNNNLITAYLKCGNLLKAREVFDKMLDRNVVSWTAMLNGYLRFGLDDEAFRLFINFVESGVPSNSKTFVCVLNLCSRRLDSELGKQIHGCIVKGNCNNLIVGSAIVHFYAQCGDLPGAFCAFDQIRERDVVCWTTIIAACSQYRWGGEAFGLFAQMLSDGFAPNEFTVCSVLKACGDEKALRFGRQLHGTIVKKIYTSDVFIGTSLVDMYAKCGSIEDSRTVFDRMRKRNTVTWTSMIAGYARNGFGDEAINLFRVMKRRKIYVNNLTTLSVLRACGLVRSLSMGKEVHAQIIRNGIQGNIYIGSTLVWLYCKCGDYPIASKVLERMSHRDVVSWTAMISGCAGLGHEYEALGFLKEMLGEGVEPNPFTYSSALKACARLEDIQQGKLIHTSINKSPALPDVFVGSALINMYAKCGCISEAIQVFDSMPDHNLVSRKAMIIAYAKNGLRGEALKLMYRMQAEGLEVDDYILTKVLTASGEFEWNVEPSSDRCMHLS